MNIMANEEHNRETNLFLETDLALHEHCENCFIVCIPNLCERYGCAVIACPHECASRFHSCKTEEHLLLCPKVKVPCINSIYGCPLWMPRRELGAHLATCPASVVYCNMERNRKPLKEFGKRLKREEGKMKDEDFLCKPELCDHDLTRVPSGCDSGDTVALDLALAYSDQRQINGLYRMSKWRRKAATNFFNKRHPALPLLPKYNLDAYETDILEDYAEDVNDSSDDENAAKRRSSIVSPVASECILCKIDPSSQHLHQLRNMAPTADGPSRFSDSSTNIELDENANATVSKSKRSTPSTVNRFYADRNLLIDLSADFLPTHYPKCGSYYTIVCDQSLRRDEYSQHFANVHNDVVDGLDGWSLVRCPLWRSGCGCYATRFEPKGGRRRVVYNRWRDTFAVQFENARDVQYALSGSTETRENEFEGNEISAKSRQLKCSYILDLPYDLILMICTMLDSNSLFCFSASCRELNELIRFSLLPSRGLVERPWMKTESRTERGRTRWIEGTKRWKLSKRFEYVYEWDMRSIGRFVEHIQKCPYYEPLIHNEERIPVLTFAKPFLLRPSRDDMYRAVPMIYDDNREQGDE